VSNATDCTPCPTGQYQDSPGRIACASCGDHATTQQPLNPSRVATPTTGAALRSNCTCKTNYFMLMNDPTCVADRYPPRCCGEGSANGL
jgi:hypothetical protein